MRIVSTLLTQSIIAVIALVMIVPYSVAAETLEERLNQNNYIGSSPEEPETTTELEKNVREAVNNWAVNDEEFNLQYNMENNIIFYDGQKVAQSCATPSPTSPAQVDFGDFKPDPEAVKQYNDRIRPKMNHLIPLYKKAAEAEKFASWDILPGIHWVEHSLLQNNVTNSYGFKTMWQMGRNEINGVGSGGIDGRKFTYNDAIFSPGPVNDNDFVFITRVAIRILKNKAKASTVNVDVSKPLSIDGMAKLAIAYNAGQASKWLTGGANPDLMPYAWAGFDTGARKLPMTYEQGTIRKPGVITVAGLLAKDDLSSISGVVCNDTEQPAGGKLGELPNDRKTLVDRILAYEGKKLRLTGYCTSTNNMRNEIRNHIKIDALKGLLAILDSSGATSVPISCMRLGHSPGTYHEANQAFDLDLDTPAGPNPDRTGSGLKIQRFVYENRQALKVRELFWDGSSYDNCIASGTARKCSGLNWGQIGNHKNHIHVAFGAPLN